MFRFLFFFPPRHRYVFNDRVSGKIFEDDITSFRSTISVDRLERAKLECHGVFSEKSFNVVGKHLSLRHNKYCQCKRFIRELLLMFSPRFSPTRFPSQRLRNLWQYFFNKQALHTYIFFIFVRDWYFFQFRNSNETKDTTVIRITQR